MLKRLRRKFVVIVMVLVGSVLLAVLGSSYINARHTQEALIDNSLARGLEYDFNRRFGSGERENPTEESWNELIDRWKTYLEDHSDGQSLQNVGEEFSGIFDSQQTGDAALRGGLLSLTLELDENGAITFVNNAPVNIESETVIDIVSKVASGEESEGHDHDLHVAWRSTKTDTGTRLAIVDTTSPDNTMHEQGVRDLQIVFVALAALFVISWWLSAWALRPVERAWEQQRRFVADASHELKTPLAVILANMQILLKHEGISDDAMRWVESTNDEAGHMKALVGDLLQLARSDATASGEATGTLHLEPLDFSEMVEAASLEFDAVAFERGCMIEEDVAENIKVTGDVEWLERLVRILIDNACKYAEEGSTVRVRLTEASGHAHLAVNNMGHPIDPEDLPHVFERFYRSDKARERSSEGGFGLGLAIAKGIVDVHGGKISVTSSEADGTTFTVVL